MPKYVKVQGTWRAVDESADCGKVKVNGVWRTVTNSYVKVGALWKSICSPATTTTTTTTTVPVTTTVVTSVPQPFPNIGSVTAYGAGAGQAWTQTQAFVTWSGSGWGSYTVIASNGSSSNSPSSAGGPPVLLSGFLAGSSYSVTVTLYANANYTGASASASTSFTTASGGATTTVITATTNPPNCGIMPSVVGLNSTQAAAAINAAGIAYEFTYETTVGATAQNNGTVQSQDPPAFTNVGSCNFSYNAGLTFYLYIPPTTGTTAVTTETTTTAIPAPFCSGATLENAAVNGYTLVAGNDETQCVGTTLRERSVLTYRNSANNFLSCSGTWFEYPNEPSCGYTPPVTTSAVTSTVTGGLPSCPGRPTNPTSATCSELGLTRLGGSSEYSVPSGWSCCGSAVSTTPTTTTASSFTFCPSLGYSVATSGFPGNCPGAQTTSTTVVTTTSPTARRICSQSDYVNQCCSCFSIGACDANGSQASC